MVLKNASSFDVDAQENGEEAKEKMNGDMLMKEYIIKQSKDLY